MFNNGMGSGGDPAKGWGGFGGGDLSYAEKENRNKNKPPVVAPTPVTTPTPALAGLLKMLQPQGVMNAEKQGLGMGVPQTPAIPPNLFSFLFGQQ